MSDSAMHVFERVGLGKAPFRCIGVFQDVGPHRYPGPGGVTIEIGAPGQAMGTCAHCGTGIADCYQIKSADGKKFVVGSSCVERTGDAGLIKSYKNSPEVRAFNRAKRAMLADKKASELALLIAQNSETLASIPRTTWDGKQEPMLDFLNRVVPRCGAAGKARYLKFVMASLAKAVQS